MRILLNATAAFRGGTKTYLSNLIPELGRLGEHHNFVLVHSTWQDIFSFDLPPNFTRLIAGPKRRSPFLRVLWEQSHLPALLRREHIDIMFSPTPATSFLCPCPLVVAIRNPNPFSPLGVKEWRYWVRNLSLHVMAQLAVKRAARIIFVSNHSRDVALKKLKIDRNKTFVIYHGVGPRFFEQQINSATRLLNGVRPYFLTVSTIQTHKNYLRLLEAVALLRHKYNLDYDFVFAGAVGSYNEFHEIQERISRPDLRGRVHYLGEISYDELPVLYKEASLFVFPSLRETFGHPLVEAMASEVPIAASEISPIPEICGDAAVYFNPYNVAEMADVLKTGLQDVTLRERLVAAGRERAIKFSWAKTAEKMLHLFESTVCSMRFG